MVNVFDKVVGEHPTFGGGKILFIRFAYQTIVSPPTHPPVSFLTPPPPPEPLLRKGK